MVKITKLETKETLKTQLAVLENYINDVPMVIDPCKMCKHYVKEMHEECCAECCYWYPSKFEVGGKNK